MHSNTERPCYHPIVVVGATSRVPTAPCPKCGQDVEVVIYNRGGQRGCFLGTPPPEAVTTFIIEKMSIPDDCCKRSERPKWSPPPGAPKKRKPFP